MFFQPIRRAIVSFGDLLLRHLTLERYYINDTQGNAANYIALDALYPWYECTICLKYDTQHLILHALVKGMSNSRLKKITDVGWSLHDFRLRNDA